MATLTVTNVPEETAARLGTVVDFGSVRIAARRTAIKKPRYWEDPSDPDNESVGPLSAEEFVAEMKSWGNAG